MQGVRFNGNDGSVSEYHDDREEAYARHPVTGWRGVGLDEDYILGAVSVALQPGGTRWQDKS